MFYYDYESYGFEMNGKFVSWKLDSDGQPVMVVWKIVTMSGKCVPCEMYVWSLDESKMICADRTQRELEDTLGKSKSFPKILSEYDGIDEEREIDSVIIMIEDMIYEKELRICDIW